jgi:hypothetical protein
MAQYVKRITFTKKLFIGFGWSVVFFVIMACCCIAFIAATNEPTADSFSTLELASVQRDETFVLGSNIAFAIESMRESDVFWGLLALSLSAALFGAFVGVLPGTDTELAISTSDTEEQALGLASNSAADSFCRNCSEVLLPEALYCHRCGQERALAQPLTMSGFVANALPDTLNVDNRLFVTLQKLLARPGFLTLEYWNVRRIPYSPPLQLYAVVSAIFFIVSVNLDFGADSLLQVQGLRINERIQARATAEGLSTDTIKLRLDDQLQTYVPIYTFFIVLALALGLKFLYRQHRYVEHIIFSLHFTTVFLLVWMTAMLVESVVPTLKRFEVLLVIIPSMIYLLIALRVAYHSAYWKLIPAALWFACLFVAYTAVSLLVAIVLL